MNYFTAQQNKVNLKYVSVSKVSKRFLMQTVLIVKVLYVYFNIIIVVEI